jgi:5-methylcytosine-specific restriction endonuclease McrA
MRVNREEIIETNEDGTPKELLKHYQCAYCKNVRATQFSVSKRESEDYKHIKPKFKKSSKKVELIKIDVHSSTGGKKTFEFQSVEEAQKFLNEFDFDKVA